MSTNLITTGSDQPATAVDIGVSTSSQPRAVSPTLFGLFIEDINFGVDGGLNANLISNHSFEGVFVDRGDSADGMPAITPAGRAISPLLHWTVSGGEIAASEDRSAVDGSHFARIALDGRARLRNNGYPGTRPALPLRHGVPLQFSALVRSVEFNGSAEVAVYTAAGDLIDSQRLETEGLGWNEVRAVLVPEETLLGYLEISLTGSGRFDIDEVSLVPNDHWGAGDPRWSQGVLRRDLVEALRDLKPSFIRFPGGCLVEGCGGDTHFKWKNSIGPLLHRRPELNMWGQMRTAGDYTQSMQVGFYEYFLLCENLGAEPLPIVWAGISCQYRTDEAIPVDSAAFDELLQDAIDLIDWATGDPATNEWAAKRAEAGHPEPFALNYIGIGNENYGPDYLNRFDLIKAALDAHRPGLITVIASGANPDGPEFEEVWDHARPRPDVVVDEHFYKSPQWFLDSVDRYDSYPREGARVFVGEYAAHEPSLLIDAATADNGPAAPGMTPNQIQTSAVPANTWESALAEAALLTGVERNSDVVAMTCYAPLFNLVGSSQWLHNLIDFTPLVVAPTLNYSVQQLFGTRLGDTISDISGELPEGLFVSASSDEDDIHIKLVNVIGRGHRIRLRIGEGMTGMAETVTLSGPPDQRNPVDLDAAAVRPAIVPETDVVAIRSGVVELALGPWAVVSVSAARR